MQATEYCAAREQQLHLFGFAVLISVPSAMSQFAPLIVKHALLSESSYIHDLCFHIVQGPEVHLYPMA